MNRGRVRAGANVSRVSARSLGAGTVVKTATGVLKAPARSLGVARSETVTGVLKAPARSTVRASLRSSVATLPAVSAHGVPCARAEARSASRLASSGTDRGGRPLSVHPDRPQSSPTDCDARSRALAVLLIPRTMSARGPSATLASARRVERCHNPREPCKCHRPQEPHRCHNPRPWRTGRARRAWRSACRPPDSRVASAWPYPSERSERGYPGERPRARRGLPSSAVRSRCYSLANRGQSRLPYSHKSRHTTTEKPQVSSTRES
jgi:hypothetical protein